MYYDDDISGLIDAPSNDWKPVWWSERKYDRTLGDSIADFFEKYLTPPRKFNDTEFKIADYQRWLLRHMFEMKPDETFRYKEIYIEMPRKQGKSFLGSGIFNYFMCKANDGDEFYVAAKDSKQADVVFREIQKNINSNKNLSLVLENRKDFVKHKYKNAFVKKLSSSSKSTFGYAPYMSIGDELWAWDSEGGISTKGQEMITSLTTGSGDRFEYMFIGITTAGSNLEGIAHERYEKAKAISRGEIVDDSFGYFIWEAEEHDDISNPKTWLKANPSLQAGIMSMERFEEDYNSAIAFGTADFERFRLNKWIKQSAFENYIIPSYWHKAEDKAMKHINKGSAITVGFDGSLTEDSTGIIGIDIDSGLMEVLYSWEKDPADDDWFVDVSEVNAAMANVFKDYDVKKLYADPSRHQEVVQGWIREYGKRIVRDIPPNAKRMVPMGDDFRQDLYNGVLKHNGNKRYSQHIMNAVENQRGLPSKVKRNSPNKIDFLVCSILANGARREALALEEREKLARSLYN